MVGHVSIKVTHPCGCCHCGPCKYQGSTSLWLLPLWAVEVENMTAVCDDLFVLVTYSSLLTCADGGMAVKHTLIAHI